MAECCAAAFTGITTVLINESWLRHTIEAGNIAYFTEENRGGRAATVAAMSLGRTFKQAGYRKRVFSLLEYAAFRGQAELLRYFKDPANHWRDHLIIDQRTVKALFFFALQSGDLPTIRLVDMWLAEFSIDPATILYGEIKTSALHLLVRHCKAKEDAIAYMEQLLKIPGSKTPFSIASSSLRWLDANGDSPLHSAVIGENLPAIQYLVERLHLSPTTANHKALTELDLMESSRCLQIKKYAAGFKARGDRNLSLLSCASSRYATVEGNPMQRLPPEAIRTIMGFLPIEPPADADEEHRSHRCIIQ